MPPAALREPLLDGEQTRSTSSDVIPILTMVASELLLASVNAVVKVVASWPSERIMLVRFAIDFVLCACACAYMKLCIPSSAFDLCTLCLRGAAYCSGITFFWAALRSCLPIGDVVVLVLSSSPLVLVLLLSRPQVHAHATQCFLAALSNDMWLLSTLSGLPCSGLDLRRPAPFCAYMAHL